MLQHDAIEEYERIHRLVLRRRGDVPVHGQSSEESRHLSGPHLTRVTLAMKEDVALDPTDIRFLGSTAVMAGTDGVPHAIEEAGTAGVRSRGLTQREHDRR